MSDIRVELPSLTFVAQPTPWDDEILGGKTMGIEIKKAGGDLAEVRKQFLDWARKEGVVFCFSKLEPENLKLRPVVHALGFYFVNSTVEGLLRNVKPEQFPYSGDLTCTKFSDKETFEQVLKLNVEGMKHGRLQEDDYLQALAPKRQTIILNKQFSNPAFVFLATRTPEGRLAGYTIASVKNGVADLIAMGIDHDALPMYDGVAFWNLNLKSLMQTVPDIKRIKARMTLTNTGVLNIYARMGFLFHSPKDEYSWYQPAQKAFA